MSDAANGVSTTTTTTAANGGATAQAAQAQHQQAAQGAQGEEGQASTQGGGAATQAVVPVGRSAKSKTFTVTTNPTTGQIHKITFHQACGDKVVKRPATSDPMYLMWNWATTQYNLARRGQRDRALVTKMHSMLNLARPSSNGSRRNSGNGAAAEAAAAQSAEPWVWETRELRLNTKDVISTTYRLAFAEDTKSPDGRPFVPNGKRGSHCGAFPHMIENHRCRGAGKQVSRNVYVVGASHLLNIKVQLLKTLEDGKEVHATEAELLDKIKAEFNPGTWSKLGHYEHRVTLYLWMELADGPHEGARVTSDLFKAALPGNAVFRPHESPPYKGNPSCEKDMQGGWAKFDKLHINSKLTTANFDKKYKNCRVRMVVTTLNPFLNGLVGFTARSVPFYPKAVLHNSANANEYYVEGPDGAAIAVNRAGTVLA
tara:strand:- start:373 stop:1656 length:1284 start_codon:yes stop_codon:yes gene_type:complete